MTEKLPDPLVPADVDLRDFSWMPIEIHRLRRSKAWLICKRKPELAFYMLNLWTAAWHDTPACSLEDDDDVLADLAMCDPAKWSKIKDQVLRGWIPCSDGRLYHPVIAIKALEAWLEKLASRLSSGAGNAKRWGTFFDPAPIEAQLASARRMLMALDPQSSALSRKRTSVVPKPPPGTPDGHPTEIPSGSQETGQGPDRNGTDRDQTGEGSLGGGDAPPEVASGKAQAADAAQATPADRGTRLPKGWQLPKPWGEWALAEYPLWTEDKVRREAEGFRDHFVSKAGKDATKRDWQATWRNWCRDGLAHRDDPKPNGRHGAVVVDIAARNAEAARLLGFGKPSQEAIDA